MNDITIFNNPEFGEIRTLEIDGQPWFVGKDVAIALGYADTDQALRAHVDNEDKLTRKIDGLGQTRNMMIINESGLYSLILGSKLESSKKFKHWVTCEVLPSIRKHGAYMTEGTLEQALTSPDFLIQLATKLKEEKEKNSKLVAESSMQKQIIGELKPKADYVNKILDNPGLVTITQIAKDYGMSGQAMNSLLHQLKVQYRTGKQWLLYADYHDKGYTHSKTINITRSDGTPDVTMETKWTQKGRLFIYELLKSNGTLPVIERKGDKNE